MGRLAEAAHPATRPEDNCVAIECITQDRAADGSQMRADLMRIASMRTSFDPTGGTEAAEHLEICAGGFSNQGGNHGTMSTVAVDAQRQVH